MSGTGEIVVIDDSYLILDRIRERLSAEGYRVRTTTGQGAAMKLVQTADLAIIDFHMPGVDGAEMLLSLRDGHPQSPCLYYLYTSDREVATRYDELGFDGAFLRKGEEAALVSQVEAVLRTIRMRKLAQKLRDERKR
jgi:two-component system, NarL family, nitrate/nitrite response regulator NarL